MNECCDPNNNPGVCFELYMNPYVLSSRAGDLGICINIDHPVVHPV